MRTFFLNDVLSLKLSSSHSRISFTWNPDAEISKSERAIEPGVLFLQSFEMDTEVQGGS